MCFTGFCGPDIDFGNGPRLFIDNFGERHDHIQLFKEYFESPKYLKSWFNYGFDRHMFYNHGIDVKGFAGDAMHMARLADPSRSPNAYSLANLTQHYSREIMSAKFKIVDNLKKRTDLTESQKKCLDMYIKEFLQESAAKIKMKNLFSKQRVLKNGELGKSFYTPKVEELHTSEADINQWVHYAVLDAESTFYLREALVRELMRFTVKFEDMNNLFDLYCKYWLPFGEVLTDLEREGIRVNKAHLVAAEKQAESDLVSLREGFHEWVKSIRPEATAFNSSSTQQLQQLLYAPFSRNKSVSAARKSKMPQDDDPLITDFDSVELDMMNEGEYDYTTPTPAVKSQRNIDVNDDFPLVREFRVENDIVGFIITRTILSLVKRSL